jgi:hypothetical protein
MTQEDGKMCLYPRLIKNRKYTANIKNGGKIPIYKDKRVLAVPVGCGKCMECRKKKARDWQVRLNEEIRHDPQALFVGLSFSDESLNELGSLTNTENHYDKQNEIAKIAVRRFLERWRKKHKKSLKHWFITELGHNNTERIHLHGIVWTKESEDVIDIWKYGHVFIGQYVNEASCNYITKYVTKRDEKHPKFNGKILTSAGIGKGYMARWDSSRNKYKPNQTKEYYLTRSGIKLALPIYYRNHIYSEEEREKLWIEKLDKGSRWVDGVEIKVDAPKDHYMKMVYQAREKNRELGYNDNTKQWEEEQYLRDLEILKQFKKGT